MEISCPDKICVDNPYQSMTCQVFYGKNCTHPCGSVDDCEVMLDFPNIFIIYVNNYNYFRFTQMVIKHDVLCHHYDCRKRILPPANDSTNYAVPILSTLGTLLLLFLAGFGFKKYIRARGIYKVFKVHKVQCMQYSPSLS